MQLLLSCEEAPLATQQGLFVEFLGALQSQLECSLQEEVRGLFSTPESFLVSSKVACGSQTKQHHRLRLTSLQRCGP